MDEPIPETVTSEAVKWPRAEGEAPEDAGKAAGSRPRGGHSVLHDGHQKPVAQYGGTVQFYRSQQLYLLHFPPPDHKSIEGVLAPLNSSCSNSIITSQH